VYPIATPSQLSAAVYKQSWHVSKQKLNAAMGCKLCMKAYIRAFNVNVTKAAAWHVTRKLVCSSSDTNSPMSGETAKVFSNSLLHLRQTHSKLTSSQRKAF
jgi:hypothetical protein